MIAARDNNVIYSKMDVCAAVLTVKVVFVVQGVTFACLNHLESGGEAGVEDDKAAGQGQGSLKMATYALRIKPQEVLEQFVAAVEGHKGGKSE